MGRDSCALAGRPRIDLRFRSPPALHRQTSVAVVGNLIQDLRHAASTPKDVVFAGRNLYVALRDESVIDVVALNRSLTPFLGTLFRLAARGHWIRKRQPLRASWDLWRETANIGASSTGGFEVRESVTADGELELVLTIRDRGIEYPTGPYPQIREFGAMLQQLQVGRPWDGLYFSHRSTDRKWTGKKQAVSAGAQTAC